MPRAAETETGELLFDGYVSVTQNKYVLEICCITTVPTVNNTVWYNLKFVESKSCAKCSYHRKKIKNKKNPFPPKKIRKDLW